MPLRWLVTLAALLPSTLAAQTCLGNSSFSDRRLQLGAELSSGHNAHAASSALALGSRYGPFISAGIGTAHDDNIDDDATVWTATGGYTAHLSRPSMQWCPFLAVAVINGIDLPSQENLSSQSYGIGAGLGTAFEAGTGLQFVPFASAAIVNQTTTDRIPGAAAGSTWFVTESNNRHTALAFGMGVVFGKVMTVRPSASFALVEGKTSRTLGVRVTYAFGRAPRAVAEYQGPGSSATVWLDTRAKMYYCEGSRTYGGTMYGNFTTERQALESGARPEKGKRCVPK